MSTTDRLSVPTPTARVLVVDDFDAMRMVVSLLLEGSGHETLAAADGRTALTLTQNRSVDLAILDVNLPDMSGLQLYRELCRRARMAQLPVIFISGRSDEKLRRSIQEIPGARFLGKPLVLESLRQVVREMLKGARPPASEPP